MASTYDPTKVKLFYGVLPVSGYADGSMIDVRPMGEGVTILTGTAGETCFIDTKNKKHEMMFRLFNTARLPNAALEALFNAGNLPLPVAILSLSTGELIVSGNAKIERIPGTTYDNNVPVREWKLMIPSLETQGLPIGT